MRNGLVVNHWLWVSLEHSKHAFCLTLPSKAERQRIDVYVVGIVVCPLNHCKTKNAKIQFQLEVQHPHDSEVHFYDNLRWIILALSKNCFYINLFSFLWGQHYTRNENQINLCTVQDFLQSEFVKLSQTRVYFVQMIHFYKLVFHFYFLLLRMKCNACFLTPQPSHSFHTQPNQNNIILSIKESGAKTIIKRLKIALERYKKRTSIVPDNNNTKTSSLSKEWGNIIQHIDNKYIKQKLVD